MSKIHFSDAHYFLNRFLLIAFKNLLIHRLPVDNYFYKWLIARAPRKRSPMSDAYNGLAQSVALPVRISRPCSIEAMVYSSISDIAFGLPGIFTIRVLPRRPASALESMALGVI